jgi:hypothetical protein
LKTFKIRKSLRCVSSAHDKYSSIFGTINSFPREKAHYVETNCAQKLVLALGSSVLALIDPTKGNHIATLGTKFQT